MAVVQISKIQLRRGKRNSESGIPQLSSAEMAWAVDTQELYIGNGSVAEGAPYVGNTKILTEHDNILELISSYKFGSNKDTINFSVFRSLQDKIDEIQVSVKDYGALGNGSDDNKSIFETAFLELFKNTDSTLKKTLVIPNGTYVFNSNLIIPSSVILKGESKNGVILDLGTNVIEFEGDNPNSVLISNLSIKRSTGGIKLDKLRNSVFDNVVVFGNYDIGDPVALSLNDEPSGIFWTNKDYSLEQKVDNILFNNCEFRNNSVSFKLLGTQTDDFNADKRVKFYNCFFKRNHIASFIEAAPNQTNSWLFDNCRFEEIELQAFKSNQGTGIVFYKSDFKVCGNGGTDSSAYPNVPIISFGQQRKGNQVIACTSDRRQFSAIIDSDTDVTIDNLPITEVENADNVSFLDRNYASIIGQQNSPKPVALFSTTNKSYKLNYTLKLGSQTRQGLLQLSIDQTSSVVSITDQYQYSSLLSSTESGQLMTNFEFSANLRINSNLGVLNDTVVLSYTNEADVNGILTFDVSYNSNS
jgi:hypothetical protein